MDPLDDLPSPRFMAEWNGENPIYGFHVRDTVTDKTYGSGLTVDHALMIADDYERHPEQAE